MPYFSNHETLAERHRKPELQLRNFHSRVKSELFRSTETEGTLLDLAAGRGADCKRYAQFSSVCALDIDADALRELIRRASCLHEVHLRAVVGDITSCLHLLPQYYDAVSLMFAAHYACRDQKALTALARNVSAHLRQGGRFVGVDMDGEAVRMELAGQRSKWYKGWAHLSLTDDDELYVTIKSIGDEPKLEWLCDWPAFVETMEAQGLHLVHTAMLDPEGSVEDRELQAFSKLHRSWIFGK